MQFRSASLANGLEVVAECQDEAATSAVGFFVKTGARDESDHESGVSHFLEHMAFKGTMRRSAEDVNREFDEMGAHYNAYTSEENTVFYAAVLPEQLPRAVDLLADILRPALRTEDFDTEKQVILEEILMYLDQPPYGADDRCKALHFGRHPLGRTILGTRDSVSALSVDAMRDYFRRRYSASNIVLAAAGRVDFDALVREAGELCGAWPSLAADRSIAPAPARRAFDVIQKEASAQEYVLQIACGPGAADRDRFAAKVLATILGDDTGSRLYWALVDPGLAESVSLSHHDYLGTGIYYSYLCCQPDETEANLAVLEDVLVEVERVGVSQEELDQAKSKLNSRIVLSSERPRGRLFNVGSNWTMRGEYRSVRDDLEAVDAVTVASIGDVLRKYPLTLHTTVAVGPLAQVSEPA